MSRPAPQPGAALPPRTRPRRAWRNRRGPRGVGGRAPSGADSVESECRAVERRDQSEDQYSSGGDHREEDEHWARHADLRASGDERDARGPQEADSHERDSEADDRAAQREEGALGHEMLDQAPVRCPKGAPHGELPPPPRGAGDHEVGRIGAGDEQHERHGALDDGERGSDVADDELLEIHRGPGGLLVLVGRLPERENPPVDGAQLVRRQGEIGAPGHTTEGGDTTTNYATN